MSLIFPDQRSDIGSNEKNQLMPTLKLLISSNLQLEQLFCGKGYEKSSRNNRSVHK